MTKDKVKQVESIINELDTLRDRLEDILSDEQDKFDELSDKVKSSDRGQEIEDLLSVLEKAHDNLQACMDELSNLT